MFSDSVSGCSLMCPPVEMKNPPSGGCVLEKLPAYLMRGRSDTEASDWRGLRRRTSVPLPAEPWIAVVVSEIRDSLLLFHLERGHLAVVHRGFDVRAHVGEQLQAQADLRHAFGVSNRCGFELRE